MPHQEIAMKNVFEKFDFSTRTINTAESALPKRLSEREYVALALLALDQAGVGVATQESILKTLADQGHA